MTDLLPVGGRILVKPTEPEKQVGTILIPDSAQDKSNDGIVLRLGIPRHDKDGRVVPFVVKEGDRVIYSPHAGFIVKLGGESALLMLEEEVVAVIRKNGNAT